MRRKNTNQGATLKVRLQKMKTILKTHCYGYIRQWQQEHGNDINIPVDATYKTTKYELPLFFVFVQTNVGYFPVAQFITQNETAQDIQEALEVMKTWNPSWKPNFFMLDYSEAEIAAIIQIQLEFKPTCVIFIGSSVGNGKGSKA